MKKYLKLTLAIIPTAFILVLGFNNCARFDADQQTFDEGTNLGSSSTPQEPPPETGTQEPIDNPYALLSAEQTLASMLKVTNVTLTPAITTEYNTRYGALAGGNKLTLANSPLMLSATSLAGAVCAALVAQETAQPAADRAFFGGVNFTTPISSLDDAAFVSSVRGMARSFWGRNESSAEFLLFKKFKTDFQNDLTATERTQAVSTTNFLVGLCAAMLSSVDSISY